MKKVILLICFLTVLFQITAQIVLLNENFENSNGLPPGWDEITTSTYPQWEISSVANSHYLVIPNHSNYASLNEGDNDETLPGEYLVTPSFDLSEYSSVFLTVDVFFKAMTYFNETEAFTIEASTDGGNSWTTLLNIEGYFNWHRVYANVSEYCGSTDVQFAFKYSDDNGWLYGIGIDNVNVFVPFSNDGALQNIKSYDFVLINDTIIIEGIVQNSGTNTINSFQINWAVNEGNVFSQNYSSQNISPLDTFSFNHNISWIPTTQEPFDIKVWISNINGTIDENPSNDTLYMFVKNAVSSKPEKKVFLEVFGATWCTICPSAASVISNIKDSTENLIIAVVHIDDPYSCDVGTEIFENYHLNPGWLVTGLVDRYNYSDDVSIDMDRYLWPHYVFQKEERISPVEINISNNYNTETRDLDIFLTATFRCDLEGDFRFNCYIVEDSLLEEQANCLTIPNREPYCFNENWIYNPPGIIENYIHMHVLREVLGGSWGTAGSLPEYVFDGDTYDFQYDFILPEEYEENNIRIIGIIQQFDSDSSKCEIFNARDMYLDNFTETDFSKSNETEFIVYPNPAKDYLWIETDVFNKNSWVEIRSIKGEIIFKKEINKNSECIEVSTLSPGLYFITMANKNLKKTKKIVII